MMKSGFTPGAIEDKRYAMFGLAEKTVFTQDEYNALKKKYPNFESFWKDWEDYVKLLKQGEEISQLATQKDALQAELTALSDQLNTSTTSGGAPLTQQLTIVENALENIDGKTDVMSLALKQTFSAQKQQIQSKINNVKSRKEQINDQINDIDKKTYDYQATLVSAKKAVDSELKNMGGTNPLDG